MKTPIYRICPSGKATRSFKRYVREWYAVIRPLEKRLGMKIIGFDPGILLSLDNRVSYNFPIWLVEKILRKKIRK